MYDENRNPFFDVKREELVTLSGISTGKHAILNSETDDVLGIVSPNYEVITNNDVNAIFEESLHDMDIKVHRTIDHMDSITRRWKRWFILDGSNFEFNIGSSIDKNHIMVEIFNSYNAKTSFGYNVMGFRSFCENGQIMGRQSMFTGKFAHFIDNTEKLEHSFLMKFKNFEKVALTWDKWTREPFYQEDLNSFIDHYKKEDNNKEKHRFLPKKLASNIVESYDSVLRDQYLDYTRWGAFNFFTYLATHKTNARKGSNIFSNGYNIMNRLIQRFYEIGSASDLKQLEG